MAEANNLPNFIPDADVEKYTAAPVPPTPPGAGSPPAAPDFIPDSSGIVPDEEKYSGAGQTLKALAEGAAETATLGLSGAFERGAGVKAEDIRGRAEAHPIAHGLGEVAGAVAPALLGDEAGALNVLGKAGAVGERAGKALVGGTSERLASRLAGWAGRGAAESGLLTGEHVLNEHILGDPNATAEHAWAEIGMSALLGGAGGAILGKTVEAGGDLARRMLDREGGLLANLTKLKPNASEIEEAATRLGVEPLPGQLSASKTVQDLQSQVAKEPTILGRKEQAAVDQQFDAIRKATTDALGTSTPMTKSEVNEVLAEGIRGAVEEVYAPLREGFEQLRARNVAFPVDQEEAEKVAAQILKIEGADKLPGTEMGALTKKASELLPLQETVDDLRRMRTAISAEGFHHTKPTNVQHVAGRIKELLDGLEEKSVNSALIKAVADGQLSQEEARHLILLNASTKEGYRELRESLDRVAKSLGKNKIHGPEHFLSIIENKAEEGRLADKLFARENSKFLKFLKEKYPEQARVLGQYQKSKIAEKAFKDGIVQPGAALREIEKLEPEAKRFVFSEQDLRSLSDAETLLDAMPKDINPSGTAKSASWNDALNPFKHAGEAAVGALTGGPVGALAGYAAGVAGPELSTFLKRSLLRKLVSGAPEEVARHSALTKLAETTARTGRAVSRAAKAVFSREVAERATLSPAERKKHADRVAELSQDPKALASRLEKLSEGMADHAPETASALAATASRAVQFLDSKRPRDMQPSPFSPAVKPSAFAEATFRRYAEAVLDPISVVGRAGDGTLSPKDLEALHAVYPRLYEGMRTALAEQMTMAATRGTPVDYRTRMGVSMFLGTAIDRSLEPQNVASTQATFAADAARRAQPPPAPAAKHSTAALSKVGAEYRTPEQAAAANSRQQA